MSAISSDFSDTTLDAAWNAAQSAETQSNNLPEVLAKEAENHYGDINVRPLFAQLALDLEKLRDKNIGVQNEEMRARRNKLSTITDFLDKANYQLMNTKGNIIEMVGLENSKLLVAIKEILPEHARKLLDNPAKLQRREVEWVCQVLTRETDKVTSEIDELKDKIFDIMQLLDKLLPSLKELLKRYDDHINYILRQPK